MAKQLDGAVQGKIGLPTFCYCNYRLLRAMQLASADSLIQQIGHDFNSYWFEDLGKCEETLRDLDMSAVALSVRKLSAEGRKWQNVKRSKQIDLRKFQKIPNWIRRNLISSFDYGNPMDYLVCCWFSSNASCFAWHDQDGAKQIQLSDYKSPGTYKIEFNVSGQKYRILIVGVRTPRIRRGKKTGMIKRNDLSIEQAQTAIERTIEAALEKGKAVHSNNMQMSDDSEYGPL